MYLALIWDRTKEGRSQYLFSLPTGKGIRKYTKLLQQFVRIEDVRQVVDRLIIVAVEESADSKNYHTRK
jgi:hypothetical protein